MVEFQQLAPLVDGELALVLHKTIRGDNDGEWAPAYHFDMLQRDSQDVMGSIELRLANSPYIVKYGGHIGYNVFPKYRGCHYAARSCRLLFPLARQYELNPLWITCNPDNIASRRSCEMAGGVLVEVVDLPQNNPMYLQGERKKCRYRIDL